ncbi:DUF4349 domain-containing protein [Flavobacterium piscis]|uniref:DUF4349 domain-containing protein n=1 Tax=Flavobacterium piscis TaxID=1114874 RepID=A0ABU1YAQ2_9FLAO|nr:DUF4349 domain-containing protein [Flavobacterium piscis]MDR7211309.1 hypothetical protein [Flavobacterium piscis]
MRYLLCLSIFVLSLLSCSKNEAGSADMMITTVKLPPMVSNSDTKYDKAELASQEIPQKIIKEATLRFETNDLKNTFAQVQTAIKQNGASIQTDSEGKNYDNIYRNITVRVPSQNFDAFIQSISKGVSYFERKDISSENVTEQYIDLTTRLKTKRKLENRYLEILQKATKISEILEIEKQISLIREEIEAKEGQLKYLESRVAESTITIEFYKTIAEKEGIKTSYGSKIITAIKTGFFELSGFLISIISVWPFIVIFCVIAYFIRKRFKRKKI